MLGIFSAVKSVGQYLGIMSKDYANNGDMIKEIEKARKDLIVANTKGSITKLISNYVVEMDIIVSDDLKSSDIIDRILEINTDMFTGYYLQSFNILKSIHNMEAKNVIDILSTNRDTVASGVWGATKYLFSKEDYYGNLMSDARLSNGFEANEYGFSGRNGGAKTPNKPIGEPNKEFNRTIDRKPSEKISDYEIRTAQNSKTTTYGGSINMDNSLNDTDKQPTSELLIRRLNITIDGISANLGVDNSTGEKIIDPRLKSPRDINSMYKDQKIVVPITIKATIKYVPISHIVNFVTPHGPNNSFYSRNLDKNAGTITRKELWLCDDLIKEYKKNRLNDMDSLVSDTNARNISSMAKVAKHGALGYERYYNMLVVSEEGARELNKFVRGDIEKQNSKKEQLLSAANAMCCTIVDRDYERVNIITKDLNGNTSLGFKQLKKRSDKTNNFDDIIKALMAGSQPKFF